MGRKSRAVASNSVLPPEENLGQMHHHVSVEADEDSEEFDPDLLEMNDPDVVSLGEPPLIGRRGAGDPSNMFGENADPSMGRASSPLIFASASNFPTCRQLRVWRWENGNPVGIGTIDAQATEEDFVRMFFNAMPRIGEGRQQFRLRPLDDRGKELGKEATITISEHHASLEQMRRIKAAEASPTGQGFSGRGDVIVTPGADPAAAVYAEEMGRMFEQQQEVSARQTRLYEEQLERERAEVRQMERERAEERVKVAERAAGTVETMTNRMMEVDRRRAEEVLASTRNQNDVMLSTLTTVFSQQTAAQREQAERQRLFDEAKAKQDRDFFDRQRLDLEQRRQFELKEAELKRQAEKDEAEQRRAADREEAEQRRLAERAEWERRQAELKYEAEQRAQREQTELQLKLQQIEQDRLRWASDQERRERADREERERRDRAEREERERKEKLEHDRFDRERQDLLLRAERERQEFERRETLRREELTREESRRREELSLSLKQMEVATSRDREHAERMMEIARQEREAAREAGITREKMEREAREQTDRERDRQHSLQVKEMELARERDREHAERMVQMTRAQSSGGLSGLGDMLGMEAPELLSRIFGGGGGDNEGGWAESIPKVLSAIADLGKVAMANQGANAQPDNKKRIAQREAQPKMIAVQNPDGTVRLIPANHVIQAQQQQVQPQQAPVNVSDLPTQPFVPPEHATRPAGNGGGRKPPTPTPSPTESPVPSDPVNISVAEKLKAGRSVSTLRRAKADNLSVLQQRKAREGIKTLVTKLGKTGEADWPGLVTEALVTTPDIALYLKAVTVYAALAEARTEVELAGRMVKAMKESGVIPEGALPYDEEDYAKIQAAEAEKVTADLATVAKEVES
jgi:hypothetical protein